MVSVLINLTFNTTSRKSTSKRTRNRSPSFKDGRFEVQPNIGSPVLPFMYDLEILTTILSHEYDN